jgi:ribonuclease Z
MIVVTLIGTGALQPLPQRALASAAITCAGRVILLDCGEGTQSAARAADVSLMKIDMIALTHYHGDHTYGLPGLLQSIGTAGRTEPLMIVGPEGLQEAMKPFLTLCPFLPYSLVLVELPPNREAQLRALLPGWPEEAYLIPFATEHRLASQGYRFELRRAGRFMPLKAKELGVPVASWKLLQRGESVTVDGTTILPGQVMGDPRRGVTVVYTGDTSLCPAISEAAKDADLLICEANYGDNAQEETALEHGHMLYAHAAQAARDAGVRRLWLTHFSPMVKDPEEWADNARTIFPDATCGQDGMRITLTFDD